MTRLFPFRQETRMTSPDGEGVSTATLSTVSGRSAE